LNGYEDVVIDRAIFTKLKDGSIIREHDAAVIKTQCRLDLSKYAFSQRTINGNNKLNDDGRPLLMLVLIELSVTLLKDKI